MSPRRPSDDRHTVAFGLDNFSSFFDHRLIEFMFRVPGTMKFRDGVTKYLLREAMRGVLPEETRTRSKKAGFNAPAHVWFSGPRRALLEDMVRSQRFRERGIFDIAEVSIVIDRRARSNRNQGSRDRKPHDVFVANGESAHLVIESRAVYARIPPT